MMRRRNLGTGIIAVIIVGLLAVPGLSNMAGPAEADELALPGTQADAPLPYLRIIAFFQSADEIAGADSFSNFDNFLASCFRFTVLDIFFDSARKENGVLGHDTDLLP